MTDNVKTPSVEPKQLELDLDREAYTVGVQFTEKVVTGITVLARDEEHARELATEILVNKDDGNITDIKVFDAYEVAKAQAIYAKNNSKMQEAFDEVMNDPTETSEDTEPTIN